MSKEDLTKDERINEEVRRLKRIFTKIEPKEKRLLRDLFKGQLICE